MTAAGRAIDVAPPVTVLCRAPECGQRARGGLGSLNGGGVARARYADALRAEPPGHAVLDSRRPRIVILPVEHQDRRAAEVRKLRRAVRAAEEVPAHDHQPGWAVAQHARVQERDDLLRNAVGPGLRLQVIVPELPHGGAQLAGGTAGCLQRRQHAAEQLSALAGEARGPGAEQGQRQNRRRPR